MISSTINLANLLSEGLVVSNQRIYYNFTGAFGTAFLFLEFLDLATSEWRTLEGSTGNVSVGNFAELPDGTVVRAASTGADGTTDVKVNLWCC